MRVTRIIESQPNIVSAKVNFASQLAKVKAKNEMCEQQNHKKLHYELERENFKAHLLKVDLHPQKSSPTKISLWKKIWNFFKRKDK